VILIDENSSGVLMTKKVRIAIAGLGNCASSLIQGLEYYKNVDEENFI
jgi:myo-inositol-1-phosphate synthase